MCVCVCVCLPQLQQKTDYGEWLWPDEVHSPLYFAFIFSPCRIPLNNNTSAAAFMPPWPSGKEAWCANLEYRGSNPGGDLQHLLTHVYR